MIASMIMQSFFFSALFGGNNREGNLVGMIIVWIVSIIVYIISTLLILALSRYREFAADRGSALITRNPRALISALNKISGRIEALPDQVKEPVAECKCILHHPGTSTKSLFRELISTHPPLEKRIANLEKVESELRGY